MTTTLEIKAEKIPCVNVAQKEVLGDIRPNAKRKVELIQTMPMKTNAIAVR